MAYLGRGIENLSDRVVLDALTASATASYTLQLNSVNFVPSSASSLTVSLNGVIQKPESSYTVSSSTLTFSSALTSSDSIDFIIAERGITLQTPSAGSVNTDQLASGAVNNSKIASDAAIATTKLGTGAVLQVVHASDNTNKTNTTTSLSELLNTSITPSSTSSKIFIIGSANVVANASSVAYGRITVLRGTTSGTDLGNSIFGASISNDAQSYLVAHYVDTPSTTSAQQYTLAFSKGSGGTTSVTTDSTKYFLTLMEIAG